MVRIFSIKSNGKICNFSITSHDYLTCHIYSKYRYVPPILYTFHAACFTKTKLVKSTDNDLNPISCVVDQHTSAC